MTKTALAMPDPDDDALGAVLIPPPGDRRGVPGQDDAIDRANAIRLLTLRAAGMTYEQIATEVGYADGSGARQALVRALNRHEAENVAELRAIENMRYDSDERVLRATISDPTVDIGVRLRAIDTRTRLAAGRARLNGTNAPLAVTISAGVQAELADALAQVQDLLVMGEVIDSTDEPPEVDA